MWLGASEEIFLGFRERQADFLQPGASIKFSILGLLVGSSCKWRRRHAIQGSGFEIGGGAIVKERVGEEGA